MRIFELMATDDRARGTLLERAVAWLEATHGPDYLAIDVSAHAPRIQTTLSLLGFGPVAYAPSMVYEAGERLDVVKMAKLRMPLDVEGLELLPACGEAVRRVVETMTENARAVEVEAIARRVGIFEGLTDVQYGRLRAICREENHAAGTPVVVAGAADRSLFVVLDGSVEIRLAGGADPVATIGPGEVFGELALIDALPRSATAVCRQRTRLVRIAADDFQALTQRDARLGLVIHRNLARAIAGRLREAGLRLEAGAAQLRGARTDGGVER